MDWIAGNNNNNNNVGCCVLFSNALMKWPTFSFFSCYFFGGFCFTIASFVVPCHCNGGVAWLLFRLASLPLNDPAFDPLVTHPSNRK